jgi:hypothetical protein
MAIVSAEAALKRRRIILAAFWGSGVKKLAAS